MGKKPRKNTPPCGAKARKGGRCQKQAGWGTDHLGYGPCRLHGGSTPAHRKRALIQMARDEMTRHLGVPVLLASVDERTIRHVALVAIGSLDLSIDDQITARDVLEAQIAGLKAPVSLEKARQIERRTRQRERRAHEERASTPTPEEEQLLDDLAQERPVIRRRRSKTNQQPEEDR